MSNKNRIEVSLNGLPYTLLTDRNEEGAREIIDYVENLVQNLTENQKSLTKLAIAQLSALNLAEELFISKDAYSKLQEDTKIPVESYPILKEQIRTQQSVVEEKDRMISLNKKYLEENNKKLLEKNKTMNDLRYKITEKDRRIKSLEENQSRLESTFLENQKLINRLQKELEELKGKVR